MVIDSERQQKEIITKCKAFIFPFIRSRLCCSLKGVDIKNVHAQTTLMNEKTAKKIKQWVKPMNKNHSDLYSFRKQSFQQHHHDRVWDAKCWSSVQ